MALEQEIVEDFDVYIQDLKKLNFKWYWKKLNVKLKEQRKYIKFIHSLIFIFRNSINMIQF